MTEISVHSVGTLQIVTKQSGDTQWLEIKVFDGAGIQDIDMSLFASEGRAITLKLGEDE